MTFLFSIYLQLAADPADEKSQKEDPPSSSRRSSSSSQPGDAPLPKPRCTTPKPATPKKTPAKKQLPINYSPKQKFVPMFTFAWDTPRFREELKSRLDDLCTLTGNSAQVQVFAKTEVFLLYIISLGLLLLRWQYLPFEPVVHTRLWNGRVLDSITWLVKLTTAFPTVFRRCYNSL